MIGDELREQLDEISVSKLAEYLCQRLDLDEGETMLQVQFAHGRYQRMNRYLKTRPAPAARRGSAASAGLLGDL